jgi:hypothetical protein
VNLCNFYSYRPIGKLIAFLQLQEFSLRILPVHSSTSAARLSPHSLRQGSTTSLAKDTALRVNLNLDGAPITSRIHTHPSHTQTSRLLSSSLSLGQCSSSPRNPVYVRRVDSSTLVFSLSSHRHSFIVLVFSSRFIDS